MSNRTPGPWEVESKVWREWSPTLVVAQPFGQLIADCGMTLLIPSDQQKANARLIAAAPDLLAALQAMLKTHDPTDTTDEMEEARAAARAVIAKAEGRDL